MAGAGMGFAPDQVRRCSVSDFLAAREGWMIAQGQEPPLKKDDLEWLDDLMSRYPDD